MADYKERFYNQLLDKIHYMIRINNQTLTDEQIEKIDPIIRKELEKEFDAEESRARIIKKGAPLSVTTRDLLPFAVKYYAMAEDNLDLLNKLEKSKFQFNGFNGITYLYALDKQFTSKFNEKQFIDLLINNQKILERYYNSLSFLTEDEREQSMLSFARIISSNPTIADRKRTHRNRQTKYYNLLTARNIDYFGEDFLINATPEQKEVIDSININLEPQDLLKVKEILEKKPTYKPNIKLKPVILSSFSAEEIINMSLKDAMLYEASLSAGLFNRMHSLLTLDPSFNCPLEFIKPEIFGCLDNKEILSLTSEGKKEIANVKIPQSAQAIIFPHLKINGLVIRDRRRKRKEEKKAFQKRK